MWLQHKSSDPNSAAIVFQDIRCHFAAVCFVQQAAIPSFASWQAFDCSGFHHSTGSANKYSFDPSIGTKYLPCSNHESKRPRRQFECCNGIHHNRSPNCAKGGTAHLSTSLSWAVLPSRPPKNRRCMLVEHGKSQVNRSWSAGRSTPEADSTASLINLT